MPITRNINPENTAQEECDQHIYSIDNGHVTEEAMQTPTLDNTEEVSSTTIDSDPIAGTNLNQTISMDVAEDPSAALPDSLKEQAASCDESASHPSSSTTTGSTHLIKGFQDAFAAFASASCRDVEEEESPMDVSNDVSNSTSEQIAVADSVGSSLAEPLVSSVDDSSQVTTTGESFVTYESDAANVYDTADVKEDDAANVYDTADVKEDDAANVYDTADVKEDDAANVYDTADVKEDDAANVYDTAEVKEDDAANVYDTAEVKEDDAANVYNDAADVKEDDAANVYSDAAEVKEDDAFHKIMSNTDADTDSQSSVGEDQAAKLAAQAQLGESNQTETVATSDSVYFIQTTDASGQVVTSIIDPNDIPSYSDSVVYKQCMKADGEIETTIVYSGGMAVNQEEPSQEQEAATSGETEIQQGEQIIYAHDISGQLTPIDPIESANDVAPPGKQFVYMQDSTGRIIRTIMDANQTMVPGQQVYYTQSDDGRIITSVMDSAAATLASEDLNQDQQPEQAGDQVYQQQMTEADTSQEASTSMVDRTSGFNIDNSMSGLSMLAELSHLTAGQASTTPGPATEQRAASSTDSSNSNDMDEFRPVAMVTRRLASEDGVDSVGSDIAELKVGETDSDSFDQSSLLQGEGAGPVESIIARIVSQMKVEQIQSSYTVSRDNLFVQWQNLDAMCWMDVVLIMLVYSPTLRPLVNLDPNHELASTLLITLLKANKQAQVLLQNLLKKNNGAVISDAEAGTGNLASIQDPKTSKLVCKENMDEIGKAINILYAMREKIWQGLQPRLRCERGKHNSPVLVLPLLVREKPDIKQMFTMSYRYMFKCEKCSYSQDDRHTKILPSFPAVPEDFNMKEPCFVRNCFECKAPDQRMKMKFEQLQDFVQMHFVQGLPHSRFNDLSFVFNDDLYEVTSVVHYKNSPDHFIAWVRNAPGSAWMECDDLKSVITRYLPAAPSIPPSQVHMVMWERRLTPQHTLVMRDTEDTKLLASLVLTVQQPNVHQQTTHQPLDTETRPAALPATSAASTQALPTNLLSGLMTTQNFTPYTSRGRGRARGNRGAQSSRGRPAATSSLVSKRVIPTVTQGLSPSSPQPATSPQVIRLPLSAFALSKGNLRGSAPAGTRYVHLGNNSQALAATSTAATRAGAPSKVLVVRSQGGNSNISAAQLLQLLQRTGAISQVGTRFTTTMSTSAANSASPSSSTTSFIIQQDGRITATTTTKDASLPYPTGEQSVEAPMETAESSSEQRPPGSLTISTLPYSGTRIESSEQTAASSSIQTSDPEAEATIHEETPGEQAGTSGQTVAISQQPGRYIQIPNPAGGGMLMCMVGMRDGKIVLVPVDKNTQAKVSAQTILKTSSTAAASPKISIHAASSTPQMLPASSAGSVLAQLQKQLVQAQTVSSGTAAGPRLITLPASSGNKRIQLITVPRGQTDATKTAIMSGQQVGSSTTSTNTDNRLLSQSSNIVIREIKRHELDNITTLPTSLCTSDSGQLVSTPAVSLLKDVSARLSTSTNRSSLLTSLSDQQKTQESFRYILPGSSTTHILHTGPTGGQTGLTPAGKIFTALSSSGTIIGGQLTPSSGGLSTTGTSTTDHDLSLGDSVDSSPSNSILTAKRRLSKELDTTEYIPLGSNRGRGRGARGRGGRGRGRSQLWNSDAELIAPASTNSKKISTLADLRQIGAHIIEAGTEAVDGIPVVSIPDYSAEGSSQTEILSAAHSIISEIDNQDVSSVLQGTEQEGSADQEPRVITQTIPSMKVNHGFDILTQGILGSANTARQPQQQARSLLTGAKTTLQSASSLLASLSESTASSLASAVQTIGQAEIETLMQAAQAAARPTSSQLSDTDFCLDDPLTYNDNVMNGQEQELAEESHYEDEKSMSTHLHKEAEHDMSIDDNQVSAAERYRMPVELFQPDEESPEKVMKVEDINRIPSGLSPRLFNSGDTPHQEEMTKCTQQHDAAQEQQSEKNTDISSASSGQHSAEIEMESSSKDEATIVEHLKSPPHAVEAIENLGSLCEPASNEPGLADEVQLSHKVSSPSRRGRRASAHKRGGRRKVTHTSMSRLVETASHFLHNEMATSETVVNYGTFPEAFSPAKESLLFSANTPDLATDLMDSSDRADKPGEDSIDNNVLAEKVVTPRKAGRPKGSRGRRKLSSTSGHEETGGTSQSEVTSQKSSSLITADRLTQASSPQKESFQPSSSIEEGANNSLLQSAALLKDEDSLDVLQDSHGQQEHQETLPPRKAGRPRGRPKGRTSIQGRKRSNIDTTRTEVTASTEQMSVSSPERFVQISSPNIEDSLMESTSEVANTTEVASSSDSIDNLQTSHLEEVMPDSSVTGKKVGRPKGRTSTSKQEATATSELLTEESSNTFLSDSIPTLASPTNKCAEIFGSETEAIQQSSSLTDSVIGTDDNMPKEPLRGDNLEVLEDSHESETSVTPKKASRSRGRPRGSSAKAAGKRKSVSGSAPETGPCPSEATVMKPDSVFTEVSSPENESLQLAPSTPPAVQAISDTINAGMSVTDSIIESEIISDTVNAGNAVTDLFTEIISDTVNAGNSVTDSFTEIISDTVNAGNSVTDSFTEIISDTVNAGNSVTDSIVQIVSDTVNTGNSVTDSFAESAEIISDKLNASDSVSPALESWGRDEPEGSSSLSPNMAARPSEGRKSKSGKRGGKKKSGGSTVPDPRETADPCPSDVTSIFSTNDDFVQTCSPRSSSTGVATSEVVTDVLTDCNHSVADESKEESKEEFKSELLQDVSQGISSRTPVSPSARESNLKTDSAELSFTKKSATPLYWKKKVNWDVSSSSEQVLHPSSSSSYKVSSGRPAASHARHPSLGPRQEFYTSPPSPLPATPYRPHKSNSPDMNSPALVIRKRPKLQLTPNADSLKVPTVFPLAVKDAACTGGSVVTSPSGGKMFTGVLVDHKHAKADWSCSPNEPQELLEYVTEQELKTAKRNYCKQLLTVFYMEAGDFSSVLGGSSNYQQAEMFEPEEAATEEMPAASGDYKTSDLAGAVKGLEEMSAQSNKTPSETINSRDKKRHNSSSESSTLSQPAKRARSVQCEGSCHAQSLPESDHPSSVDTPSQINGTDTEKASASSSQSEPVQADDQRETTRPFSFPSPTRRSGRTPIPSKKILDALEDTPFLSSLKVRRVSSVSSEDTQSGYTSDDMPQSRGNTTSSTS